jgi:NodT family efflux transporter outer membrane factor (OMF) lipoprotein
MKRHYILMTTITMVALLVSSCKVSRDLEVPDDAFPETYRESVTADSSQVAQLDWKSFFPDTVLQKLIDSALTKNNDLLAAQRTIEAAQWQLKQTKWGNIPQLGLEVGAQSNRPSDNSLNGLSSSSFLGQNHIEDYNAMAQLSWEADLWGKIRNRKKGALARYLQTGEAKKALQTLVVANVAKGYYNLLMLDAQLDIAKRNLELSDSTLFVIDLQYSAGQVTSLAQQQANVQRLRAAELIPLLEQQIAVQENALSVLSGSFPTSKERGIPLDLVALPESMEVGIPSQLLSQRPDVKSAELGLRVSNAEVGIARASMYPALNITAAGGINSFKSSNWFNIPASLFGTVAGSLSQPLLQGQKLRSQYKISELEREKAVLDFRQSVLVAVGEVSDALVKVEKLEEQQLVAFERVETLKLAINNADMLFKNGMATYLEVITAQENLLQSELDLAVLKMSQLAASVDLYRSLGGGWN